MQMQRPGDPSHESTVRSLRGFSCGRLVQCAQRRAKFGCKARRKVAPPRVVFPEVPGITQQLQDQDSVVRIIAVVPGKMRPKGSEFGFILEVPVDKRFMGNTGALIRPKSLFQQIGLALVFSTLKFRLRRDASTICISPSTIEAAERSSRSSRYCAT